MHHRFVLAVLFCFSWFVLGAGLPCEASADRPNILFITVDDMSCDSVGVFGCKLKDTTPHMDRLAEQGLRFQYAHVQVGNCKPCRNVLWSGLYPHTNGVEGFYSIKDKKYPVLADLMKQGGYYVAIRGKASHSTPYYPYPGWDDDLTKLDGKQQHLKDIDSYYQSTKRGIANAKKAGKPFCIMVNISDPHKPFYAGPKDKHQPTLVFNAKQMPIPGFLFDHPAVRQELALYYTSVRRADDCVGATLKALEESGHADNTVVMFLSDHGMPLPFAKTQLYHHSTHTPWMVRWPGKVKANSIDKSHMISGIDALPTLLDITGIKHPNGLQGESFLPLLEGKTQPNRDFVFKEYNENAGGGRHPMRAVQSKKYLYLFNPWSDGQRKMKTATTGTVSYRTMQKLAQTNKKLAARLHLFDHRVREEFYDIDNDPDCLHNLAQSKDAAIKAELNRHRAALLDWMKRTDDHMHEVFANRDDRSVSEAYMKKVETESAERRKNRRSKNRNQKNKTKKNEK